MSTPTQTQIENLKREIAALTAEINATSDLDDRLTGLVTALQAAEAWLRELEAEAKKVNGAA